MDRRVGIALAAGAIVAAGVAAWALAPRPEPPPARPNVLVVVWDAARADRMSLYGHDRPTTPRLDALARDAAVYERAISPGEWTVPAVASLFTGLPVASHGASASWLWLDGHHLTMAEHFAASGYRTYAWSSNPHLGEHTNLMQGFETVEHPFDPERADASTRATAAKLLPTDRSCELGPAWEPPAWFGERARLVPKDAGPVAADAVLDWIGQAGQPFFAFVDLMEAHAPRVPSKEAREAVADDALRAKQLTVDATQFRVLSAMEGKAAIPAQDRAVMASVYDAALWDLDRATARLLDGLEARGLLDDTIVVITSDHGENLGERGMYEHRWDLHETLVHVPLVVRWPRGVEAGRISAPVSTQHLFGTLVRLAGLPAPAVSHALPALGEEPRVFSELVVPGARDPSIRRNLADLDPERWNRRYAAVYEGDLKLLQTRLPGGELTEDLFDLAADPDERSDLSNYRRDDATRLEEALAQWRATRPRYSPELREPTDRPRRTDRIAGVDESLSALGSDGRRAAKAAKAARTGPK